MSNLETHYRFKSGPTYRGQMANPMMTSSNGNIFRVTGPLCGELTGYRWIPLTKASDAELWRFLWPAPWMNGCVNIRKAGDFRRHRAQYDVIVIHSTKHSKDNQLQSR